MAEKPVPTGGTAPDGANGGVGEDAPCEIEVAPSLFLSAPGSPALMTAAPGISFESRPILTVP